MKEEGLSNKVSVYCWSEKICAKKHEMKFTRAMYCNTECIGQNKSSNAFK